MRKSHKKKVQDRKNKLFINRRTDRLWKIMSEEITKELDRSLLEAMGCFAGSTVSSWHEQPPLTMDILNDTVAYIREMMPAPLVIHNPYGDMIPQWNDIKKAGFEFKIIPEDLKCQN